MKVIYFGTPQFAANVLQFLIENNVNIAAIVTKPDKPKGRSGNPVATPVKTIAEQLAPSIPIYQPEFVSNIDFAPVLQQYEADLFVVVAYGEIIKQHLLDMPKLACINLHASLLPKWRGAAPIQRCIMAGDKESGLTVMHMVKKMDAGNMIRKIVVPIGPNINYGELEQNLCEAGKKALLDVLREFTSARSLPGIEQDPAQVTFAPKVELEDCEILWEKPADQLHDLVRGVNPEPVAWCWITVKGEMKRLKVFATAINKQLKGIPGEILSYGNNGWIIACKENSLELLEVQLEGKKRMSAQDLMRGLQQTNISFSNQMTDQ